MNGCKKIIFYPGLSYKPDQHGFEKKRHENLLSQEPLLQINHMFAMKKFIIYSYAAGFQQNFAKDPFKRASAYKKLTLCVIV